MFVKACLNGARRPGDHPALPLTPAALAIDARAVVAAGAQAVHLHVKDESGLDTLADDATHETLSQVRAAVPGTPIGVTTGQWACPDPDARVEAVRRWRTRPDFASVNWHERGAEQLACALLRHGIEIEAGLWHEDAVRSWLACDLRVHTMRVLVELPDGLDERGVRTQADRLLGLLHDGAPTATVLLHGEGTSTWPAIQVARERGLATRIGLEDTLTDTDGAVALDNATLLAHVVHG